MKQKKIWMRFLPHGSLTLLIHIFLFCSCESKIDYIQYATWVYENHSSQTIDVQAKVFNSFSLTPGKSYVYEVETAAGKYVTPESYSVPYYADGTTLIVGEKELLLLENESILDISSYNTEKIEDRHYRFTYTFTDEIIDELLTKKQRFR